jgi:hypothetical protein
MPLYELVLRYEHREEIRLTDRTVSVGATSRSLAASGGSPGSALEARCAQEPRLGGRAEAQRARENDTRPDDVGNGEVTA